MKLTKTLAAVTAAAVILSSTACSIKSTSSTDSSAVTAESSGTENSSAAESTAQSAETSEPEPVPSIAESGTAADAVAASPSNGAEGMDITFGDFLREYKYFLERSGYENDTDGSNADTIKQARQQIIDAMGGPEKVITGILVRLEGDIKGMMMFLLEDSFAQVVLSTFMNAENVQVTKLGDMELSVITEMGNIMAGSYLRALSTLTGLTIDMSIPSMTVDRLGALMSVPITEFAQVGDKVLFIDDGFKIDGVAIKSNIILIPEMESLETLMKKLGVM